MVRVANNDDASLTFELSVAEDEGGWKAPEVSGAALPASGYYDTKLVSEDGKVYQLCSAFRKAPRVFCLEGSVRSDLGAPSECSENFYAVDLAVCDGVVYLCGSDGVRTVVWRRTGSSWSVVDEIDVPATSPVMGVVARGVYLFGRQFWRGGSLYRVGAGKLSKVGIHFGYQSSVQSANYRQSGFACGGFQQRIGNEDGMARGGSMEGERASSGNFVVDLDD